MATRHIPFALEYYNIQAGLFLGFRFILATYKQVYFSSMIAKTISAGGSGSEEFFQNDHYKWQGWYSFYAHSLWFRFMMTLFTPKLPWPFIINHIKHVLVCSTQFNLPTGFICWLKFVYRIVCTQNVCVCLFLARLWFDRKHYWVCSIEQYALYFWRLFKLP